MDALAVLNGEPGDAGAELVVLGDSVAEGRNDPDQAGGWRGWAGRLAEALYLPEDRVVNAGTPGAGLAQVVAEELPAVRHLRPRMVILSCGMNDAINGFDRVEAAGHLAEILGWARSVGAVGIVAPVPRPPLLERSIISNFRKNRILERIQIINEELSRAARAFGMEFLESEAVPLVMDQSLWAIDGIHLNPAGHAYVAEVITQVSRNLLGEHATAS
ncbi:SGNH/GDSL hydrolase family protein [Actinomadura sp. SCN-SB]|uniref:SGNH/GDSL hydrolase family protein n=1 Tax=Actinomadura sp. SCN-SB TaxID=3373092 RepID=UPI003753E6FE